MLTAQEVFDRNVRHLHTRPWVTPWRFDPAPIDTAEGLSLPRGIAARLEAVAIKNNLSPAILYTLWPKEPPNAQA